MVYFNSIENMDNEIMTLTIYFKKNFYMHWSRFKLIVHVPGTKFKTINIKQK